MKVTLPLIARMSFPYGDEVRAAAARGISEAILRTNGERRTKSKGEACRCGQEASLKGYLACGCNLRVFRTVIVIARITVNTRPIFVED